MPRLVCIRAQSATTDVRSPPGKPRGRGAHGRGCVFLIFVPGWNCGPSDLRFRCRPRDASISARYDFTYTLYVEVRGVDRGQRRDVRGTPGLSPSVLRRRRRLRFLPCVFTLEVPLRVVADYARLHIPARVGHDIIDVGLAGSRRRGQAGRARGHEI